MMHLHAGYNTQFDGYISAGYILHQLQSNCIIFYLSFCLLKDRFCSHC